MCTEALCYQRQNSNWFACPDGLFLTLMFKECFVFLLFRLSLTCLLLGAAELRITLKNDALRVPLTAWLNKALFSHSRESCSRAGTRAMGEKVMLQSTSLLGKKKHPWNYFWLLQYFFRLGHFFHYHLSYLVKHKIKNSSFLEFL